MRAIMPSALMRVACIGVVDAATFRGWVNLLSYVNENTGSFSQLMLDDGDSAEMLPELIREFQLAEPAWREVLRRKRVGSQVGSADCDVSLESSAYLFHAQQLESTGIQLTRTYLNIGASDGVSEDPLYDYIRHYDASGYALEKDEGVCVTLKHNLESARRHGYHRIICSEITPYNIEELLQDSLQPGQRHFDVIKLDIDSYDADILDTLLAGFKDGSFLSAKHFILEVNPAIPPPLKFSTRYHPELVSNYLVAGMKDWPLRGMSLSYAIDVMSRHGYDFVAFGFHDAIFIKRELRGAYGYAPPYDEFDCFHRSFISSNGVPIHLTRSWFYHRDRYEARSEIFRYLVEYSFNATGKYFPFDLN